MGDPKSIPRLARGAYADVLDLGDGTVIKAYRREPFTSHPVEDWRDHDALTRLFFEAEATAYERLANYPDLVPYTPVFFGRVDPCAISSLAEPPELGYVRGCGLRLEKVPGKDVKVASLSVPIQREVEEVLWCLKREVGAGHVWDASCFVPGTRAKFTLIDFTTPDWFFDRIETLKKQGRFTDEQRTKWPLWRAEHEYPTKISGGREEGGQG